MRPARVLAPAALVAAALALFAILLSGGGGDTVREASPAPTPTATATPVKQKKAKPRPSGRTYVVKPGDTPSAIAEKEGVPVKDLLAVNPDIDPAGLTVGEELQLP